MFTYSKYRAVWDRGSKLYDTYEQASRHLINLSNLSPLTNITGIEGWDGKAWVLLANWN